MKYTLTLVIALAAALAYLTRRESKDSMQKRKPAAADRMSHRWRVETAYAKDGDAA